MGRVSLREDLWLDLMRVIGHGPKMAWAVDEDMIDDLTATIRTIVHRYGEAIIHHVSKIRPVFFPISLRDCQTDHYIHPLPANGLNTS